MFRNFVVLCASLSLMVVCSRNVGTTSVAAIRNEKYRTVANSPSLVRPNHPAFQIPPRGGGADNSSDDDDDTDIKVTAHDDSERYSRQVYVLGARAHALVRTSTIVVDGPQRSGLFFECIKNLALSGVGSIIILVDDDDNNDNKVNMLHKFYHNEKYDDLGNAYTRAALEELSSDETNTHFIVEFLQRLNPSLSVSIMNRSNFATKYISNNPEGRTKPTTAVYLCIDRPESTQLTSSQICRKLQLPFVSTESVGVYGRVFCDFGSDFVVLDPDGETPRQTLLDRVELIPQPLADADASARVLELTVYCVGEAKHDVSRGDFIQFHWKNQAFEQQHHEGKDNSNNNTIVAEVLYVKSPSQFTVRIQRPEDFENCDEEQNNNNQHDLVRKLNQFSHYFSKIKQSVQVPFVSMQDALEAAKKAHNGEHIKDQQHLQLFTISDFDKSFDITRRNALMACFSALGQFASDQKRLPSSEKSQSSVVDEQKFLHLVQNSEFYSSICCNTGSRSSESLLQQEPFEKIVKSFARCSDGKLVPMQALMGAIAAQEVLKAVSRLYRPIQQFLLYDCDELLQEDEAGEQEGQQQQININNDDANNDFPNIAPGQTIVLGQQLSTALSRVKIFVVGSGAIGCELLKNLAAAGAATDKKKGKLVVTDMDTIEKSNLSRQLLFRDNDVGKFKSVAAEQAVKRFNRHVQIEAHTSKVGEGVYNSPFNEVFWREKVDVVMNALDNMEARLFMDNQCVQNGKGMIDAGTLGAMGNVQVVVPFQSESYGSSVDPPEPLIPVCTLKNFPYEISHTIQWARDLFDGLYNRRPTQVNSNIKTVLSLGLVEFSHLLQTKLGKEVAIESAKEITEDLAMSIQILDDGSDLMEVCVQWAVHLFQDVFVESIKQLRQQHPEDSVDEDGEPFWSGSRKMPQILEYCSDADEENKIQQDINRHIVDFVRSAARLRFEIYVRDETSETKPSDEQVITALMTSMPFNHEQHRVDANDVVLMAEKVKALHGKFEVCLNVVEFEKDDETNGHVAFVSAASNLRALSYGIVPVDILETRRISGNIVPAMITTTALVSALSCIELFKLVKAAPLSIHRNAFVNLALPFFAFTPPLPAEPVIGLNGKTHTLWDRTIINEGKKSAASGGIKLSELLKKVKKKIGGSVTSLYYGPYMIYADFLHSEDKIIVEKSVMELVKEALISDHEFRDAEENDADRSNELHFGSSADVEELESKIYLELSAVVEDENTGEDAEIPSIRITRWQGGVQQNDLAR